MPAPQRTQEFSNALILYDKAVTSNENTAIFRTEAYSNTRSFPQVGGTTIRSDYNYGDYSYYRPSDSTSAYIEDIIADCMLAYRNEPIVHQIIDLMSDFGSQGVRLICSDKSQEKFGAEWARYIDLTEFADKFLRTLYLSGTVIVKRTDGKIPLKTQKKWKSVVAGAIGPGTNPYAIKNTTLPMGVDPEGMVVDMEKDERNVRRAVLPLQWTIHDPRSVVMVGGTLANFVGKPIFGLRINTQLRQELAQMPRLAQSNEEYQNYLNFIPKYVFEAINSNAQFFPLDQSKVYAYYYKKDDWELWGKPLIEPILGTLKRHNKLKLADMSALDGAISSVRLWRLGSLEHNVVPSSAQLTKLRNIISQNVAGGTMDFVWGPDLDFKESTTTLHNFLGPEKYDSTLTELYAGLGVPAGLTGSSSGGSFTNNYVGLKTLIERLKYGRNVLIKFLNEQLRLVEEAMGFKRKFKVVFDHMVLSDEAAEKKLLVELWDRDLISEETLRYAFDIDNSDVEDTKIARQARKRGKQLPAKTGPYSVDKAHELKKIFATSGSLTPSEVGLELEEKDSTQTPPAEFVAKFKPTPSDKPKGGPGGRPINSKDETQRKKRRVMPKGAVASYSELFKYAESAKLKIDEILTDAYLNVLNKKTVRSLTVEETNTLESIKFNTLSNLSPFTEIDEVVVAGLSTNSSPNVDFYKERASLVYNFEKKYGRSPSIQEKRKLECEAFAEIYSEN